MSITIENLGEITKNANVRMPEEDATAKFETPSKKLGSRITKAQTSTVAKVITNDQIKKLAGTKKLREALTRYAETGDKAQLDGEQSEVLSAVVKAGREASESESKARRIWPRKVAAMVLHFPVAS